jgi:hypothetical protein
MYNIQQKAVQRIYIYIYIHTYPIIAIHINIYIYIYTDKSPHGTRNQTTNPQMQNTQSTGPNNAARQSPTTIEPYVLLERPSNAPHDARMHARMLPHDVRMYARMFPRILPTCCRARRPDHDPEIEAKGVAVREALSRLQGRQANSSARSKAQEVKTAK